MTKCFFNRHPHYQVVIWAGVVAGTLATLIQVLLWIIFTDDFPSILFRDARLTAALILGESVLPPPSTFNVWLMLLASVIHFTLSIAYATLLSALTAHLNAIKSQLAGIGFGIALYMVNLYGFTLIFPWFTQARGWITLIAHIVFSMTAVLIYRWLRIMAKVKILTSN